MVLCFFLAAAEAEAVFRCGAGVRFADGVLFAGVP
jgi:hypothetical protein